MKPEQLSLFSPPREETETEQKPSPHPLDGTWWRPKTTYRYNENGRPSGWVLIPHNVYALVYVHETLKRLRAAYSTEDQDGILRHYCDANITAEDLSQYFDRIPEPEQRKAWEE